ncbi:(R)-mandelonitrile lyase 1-like [Cucumis melo var. makuwa]|uniref:(R)-mandelonitrile lyase 1-like n=1 Tax=Cucumis melo var. makuwa TaxID=1194695 RepID=A0A5D3CSP6_CUCMM|nr:(R)-mandelonitrile lyase 1-like [Cucumis melo var. makuwa]TYK14064.1 (R)-mandelonitrile lyase 1-like [Cucumis melo var. makuwa]
MNEMMIAFPRMRLDVDSTMVERPIVRHVVDNFINDDDEQLSIQSRPSTMSNFLTDFGDSNSLFYFNVEEFNNIGGTSLVSDMSDASQPTAQTPRRRKHLRNLELERYVAQDEKIPIPIAPQQDISISSHVVRFSNTIDVLTWDTFPVRFLKWTNVTLEYIKLVKCDLQEQSSMNRVVRVKQPYNDNSGVKSFL